MLINECASLEEIVAELSHRASVYVVASLDDEDDYVNIFEISNSEGDFYPKVERLNTLPVIRSSALH